MVKDNKQPVREFGKIRSLPHFLLRGEGGLRFWESVGSGLSLINSFFILSSLSLYHFGVYQLILSLIGIVGSFNSDQFDGVVSVEVRHNLNSGRATLARRLFLEYSFVKISASLVLVGVVFAGASIASAYYGRDIGLFIKIASAVLVIEAVQSLQRIFFKSVFSFAYFSAPAMRELGKFLLLASFFFLSGLDITKVIIIHILGWFVSLLFTSVSFFMAMKTGLNWLRKSGETLRERFLLPALVRANGKWVLFRYGLAKLTQNTTPWFIKFFVGTEAVALYSVARNLVAMLEELFPVNMVSYVFLMEVGDQKKLRHLFVKSVKYVFWFGVVFGVLTLVLVPPMIVFLLPKYESALGLFMVMLLAFPVFGVYKLIKSMLNVLREYKILAMRLVTESLVALASLTVLLPILGVYGAAVSYVLLYIARFLFFFPLLVRSHPYLRFRFQDLFRFDEYDKDFIKKLQLRIFEMLGGFVSRTLKKR